MITMISIVILSWSVYALAVYKPRERTRPLKLMLGASAHCLASLAVLMCVVINNLTKSERLFLAIVFMFYSLACLHRSIAMIDSFRNRKHPE